MVEAVGSCKIRNIIKKEIVSAVTLSWAIRIDMEVVSNTS